MKTLITSLLLSPFALNSHAQSASVDIKLAPAGSFTIPLDNVKGYVVAKKTGFETHDVSVDLSKLKAAVALSETPVKGDLKAVKIPVTEVLTSNGPKGQGRATIKMNGATKDVVGTYKVLNGKMLASFPVMLSDFQIHEVKYMGLGVENEASVTVELPIHKSAVK